MRHFLIAAAGVSLVAVAARADEPFVRKAGEWEITLIDKDGSRDPPDKFCHRAASAADLAKGVGDCRGHDIRASGNTTTVDAVCMKDSLRMIVQMTIVAAGDTAYRSQIHVAFSPPIGGKSSLDAGLEAKWLGPCTPSQEFARPATLFALPWPSPRATSEVAETAPSPPG